MWVFTKKESSDKKKKAIHCIMEVVLLCLPKNLENVANSLLPHVSPLQHTGFK